MKKTKTGREWDIKYVFSNEKVGTARLDDLGLSIQIDTLPPLAAILTCIEDTKPIITPNPRKPCEHIFNLLFMNGRDYTFFCSKCLNIQTRSI